MSLIAENCKRLIDAYKNGLLGDTTMPEESNPGFTVKEKEQRFSYFTLPMALNYQRNSYKLWEAALATYKDAKTNVVFDVKWVANNSEEVLRRKLLKHKLALQPNKHVNTWFRVANTVHNNWGTFSNLFDSIENDFLKLKDIVQKEHKKGFPYLSGPKIFNYWSHILIEYAGLSLENTEYIEIAPDTHVMQASVRLGLITKGEAEAMSKEDVNKRWRGVLKDTGITPIEMHSPLWFWSRSGFEYELDS
jgi:hypothetical protein